MDKLDDLPTSDDENLSPQEEDTMKRYFDVNDNTSSKKKKWNIDWKFIGICVILFIILANPWVDGIFCKIPYCGENGLMLLFVKALIFAILLILVQIFVK